MRNNRSSKIFGSRWRRALFAVAIGVTIGAGTLLLTARLDVSDAGDRQTTAATNPAAHAEENPVTPVSGRIKRAWTRPSPAGSAAPDSAVDLSVNEQEVLRDYNTFQTFRTSARTFFDTHETLDVSERLQKASELAALVHWAEDSEYLLPVEALALHLGLLKVTTPDETTLKARAQELTTRYREAQAREIAAIQQDPRHRQYRAQEAIIVENVMRSGTWPDAATRNKELRRQLAELRSAIYSPENTSH